MRSRESERERERVYVCVRERKSVCEHQHLARPVLHLQQSVNSAEGEVGDLRLEADIEEPFRRHLTHLPHVLSHFLKPVLRQSARMLSHGCNLTHLPDRIHLLIEMILVDRPCAMGVLNSRFQVRE